MAVLVKDIKIPRSCESCPCKTADAFGGLGCQATGYIPFRKANQDRPDWCPLISVPKHGRLIDEQWLKDAMITTLEALMKNPKMDRQEMHLIAAFDTLRTMVEDAPTIIPADRTEVSE